MKREIKLKSKELDNLLKEHNEQLVLLMNECKPDLYKQCIIKLSDLKNTYKENVLQRIQKKLNNLYDGIFLLSNYINNYINLSNHQISNDERKFLNLGLNFHIQPKYDNNKFIKTTYT